MHCFFPEGVFWAVRNLAREPSLLQKWGLSLCCPQSGLHSSYCSWTGTPPPPASLQPGMKSSVPVQGEGSGLPPGPRKSPSLPLWPEAVAGSAWDSWHIPQPPRRGQESAQVFGCELGARQGARGVSSEGPHRQAHFPPAEWKLALGVSCVQGHRRSVFKEVGEAGASPGGRYAGLRGL